MQIRTIGVWKSDFVGPSFHFPLRFSTLSDMKLSHIMVQNHKIVKSFWSIVNMLESWTILFFRTRWYFPPINEQIFFWRLRKGYSKLPSYRGKKAKQNRKQNLFLSQYSRQAYKNLMINIMLGEEVVIATGKILLSKDACEYQWQGNRYFVLE